MIRRGGTYGPPLPEGAPEDGVERGIAAFVGCASLVRQFEFAMNVWVNDPNFHELGNERDPIIGTQDGTFDMTIPKRPIRKKIMGLPAFTTPQGRCLFLSSRYQGAPLPRRDRMKAARSSSTLSGWAEAEAPDVIRHPGRRDSPSSLLVARSCSSSHCTILNFCTRLPRVSAA